MLNVIVMNVIMLSVVVPSVIMLSVVVPSVIMLSVITLHVEMFNVVAPYLQNKARLKILERRSKHSSLFAEESMTNKNDFFWTDT
jgi:hypothetical protein